MTALAATRNSSFKTIKHLEFTLTSGTKAYQGGTAALVLGTGKVVPATGVSGQVAIGLFNRECDATAADKVCSVQLFDEITAYWRTNDTGTAVAATDLGAICYHLDDQTVTMALGKPMKAGRVWAVDSVNGVLVEPLGILAAPAGGAGAALTWTSNNVNVTAAQAFDGAVFDIPTTAANSTVTLPVTGVPDGTRLHFTADGTKNGHTITYRFGTTAIADATTASKRHGVTVVKLGSAWSCVGYNVMA